MDKKAIFHYSAKVVLSSGKVISINSKEKRRFSQRLQATKKLHAKFFNLAVHYGKAINNFGALVDMSNSGTYDTYSDCWLAWKAFSEP